MAAAMAIGDGSGDAGHFGAAGEVWIADEVKAEATSSTSEKTQVPVDTDEPTSEGGNAVIKKDQTEEHLLAVAQEDDDSEKVKLQEKKVKKRKRKELQQIKQEKMVNDAEKSHLTVYAQQPHLPCDAEQEHLLAVSEEDDDSDKVKLQEKKVKKRKRRELQQIKQEKLVSDGKKIHLTVDAQQPHLPCGAEQEHLHNKPKMVLQKTCSHDGGYSQEMMYGQLQHTNTHIVAAEPDVQAEPHCASTLKSYLNLIV